MVYFDRLRTSFGAELRLSDEKLYLRAEKRCLILQKSSPEDSIGDIMSRHLTEFRRNLISKLNGRGRMRARCPKSKSKRKLIEKPK